MPDVDVLGPVVPARETLAHLRKNTPPSAKPGEVGVDGKGTPLGATAGASAGAGLSASKGPGGLDYRGDNPEVRSRGRRDVRCDAEMRSFFRSPPSVFSPPFVDARCMRFGVSFLREGGVPCQTLTPSRASPL